MMWAAILDGAYSISEDGDVRRDRPARGATVGATIRQVDDRNGYRRVGLSINGRPKYHWTHHLVAAAFLGARPAGMQINHIDGNKTNNHYSNLEYVSPSANMQHAIRTGLRVPSQSARPGARNGSAKIGDAEVRTIREKADAGVPVRELCALFALSKATVHKIIKRQSWRHVQ
jgi:hypothetical protein